MVAAVFDPASLVPCIGFRRAGPGEVHCWPFELDTDAATLALCYRSLCPEERARADRFAFPVHRDRFVVAHGIMRHLLAGYLGLAAPAIRLDRLVHGKPVLAGPQGRHLAFNLSHSENRAVLAVSDGREVGIDLERVRRDLDVHSLARSTFTAPEVDYLARLPADLQAAAFFRCWVAKEAVLKGEGAGLALPVDSFEIAFGEDGEVRVLPHASSRVRGDWTIRELSLGPDWPAAVAARGPEWRIRLPQEGSARPGR